MRRVALPSVAALLALTAACADAPSAPSAPLAAGPAAHALVGTAASPVVETFVYDGRARTQSFGDGHAVHLDANSVCDPQSTVYAPGVWDQPCAPATAPITFTVKSWRDADGRARVTFSPDVRFVPGTAEVLYLSELMPGLAKKATILWCSPLLANGCVDESLTDADLGTWVANGLVARRIKHFSGYNVVFGLAPDPTLPVY